MGLDAPGLALVLLGVNGLDWCRLWWFLASLLHVIYRNMQRWDTNINAMHVMQRIICYIVVSNLTTWTPMIYLLNYP
jgi:hypothetical protein